MKISNTIQTRITLWQKQVVWRDFSPIFIGALTLILLIPLEKELTFLHPLRVILGLVYVLFIPGYCLTTALFPQKTDLQNLERLGLSIGFSVASISVLALLLDWLQLGLYPWSILLGEFGMTGLFVAVTLRKRSKLPFDVIYAPSISWRVSRNTLSISNRRFSILLMLGLAISALAVWVFLTPVSGQSTTEFYILGSEGLMEKYPYQVGLNDAVRVNVGVINRETTEIHYHFEVWVTDNLNSNRRERVLRSDPFLLQPGEKFEHSVSWNMPWVGDDQEVELLLFYDNDPKPSRQLRMWINVWE